MQPFKLLAVGLRSPREFLDRVSGIAQSRIEQLMWRPVRYEVDSWGSLLRGIVRQTGARLEVIQDDSSLRDARQAVLQNLQRMGKDRPFKFFHNGDPAFAELCYLLVRALTPKLVVETGVCYGVTSTYILQGMAANGTGELRSIDLPPLGKDGDSYVGRLIPDDLKKRWRLYRGVSKTLLPAVLNEVTGLDIFVHDSLHTYRNMSMEFNFIWPRIRPGGALIADDIQDNSAFFDLTLRPDVAFHGITRENEKKSLFGIAFKSRT